MPLTITLSPRQGELNAAIDLIGRLLQKYHKLLLAMERPRLLPSGLKNVMATFRVPWVSAPE